MVWAKIYILVFDGNDLKKVGLGFNKNVGFLFKKSAYYVPLKSC